MIEKTYIEQRPISRSLYEKAMGLFPGGVTHDIRYLLPFPVYIKEARGSRKWDVDGNEYVDFSMGHGALILGHGREEVVNAVREAVLRGTHYGGSSELEIRWADWVKRLIPSAEKVKFTSSGTEATLLAVRIARAYTGKNKIVKFYGHFHGWHDYLIVGERPPWDAGPVGVPCEVLKTVVVIPPDLSVLESLLSQDKDIAGVIVEPTGGSWGKVPIPEGFLADLRDVTRKHNVILIFDEVVTGFRWSPGGVQGLYGVIPDLTTLAKILAGGFPGGAVVGKGEVMDVLGFGRCEDPERVKRVIHQGTFNANPVSASAGIACLEIVSTGIPQKEASEKAREIRVSLNEVIRLQGVKGCVYGESSVFHIVLGVEPSNFNGRDIRDPELPIDVLKSGARGDVCRLFQLSMLVEGVDIFHMGGLVSSVHTDEDIEKTIRAFETTLKRLKGEGVLD